MGSPRSRLKYGIKIYLICWHLTRFGYSYGRRHLKCDVGRGRENLLAISNLTKAPGVAYKMALLYKFVVNINLTSSRFSKGYESKILSYVRKCDIFTRWNRS